MRVLLIGFPLPNPAFDNYDFIQAPSFYDFDAVVIEPAQVSKVIEDVLTRSEDHQTFAGEPVLIEARSPRDAKALMDSAMRAIKDCQPFAFLPPEKYREWKVLDLSFTPRDMLGGG